MVEFVQKKAGISSTTLKLLAVILMLIDHTGAVMIENGVFRVIAEDRWGIWFWFDYALRFIGRVSFPIFAFLLVQGFCHTGNVKKYGLRLLAFAFISEIPFDLAVFGTWFYPESQNIYVTLLIGIMVLFGIRRWKGSVSNVVVILAGCVAAELLRSDYGAFGIILICAFYFLRAGNSMRNIVCAVLLVIESLPFFGAAALALIPISLYSGERGKWRLKYVFYWFYPVHLLLLYGMTAWILYRG